MPKFKVLKDGVNEELLNATLGKVEQYLKNVVEEDELTTVDGISSFPFGTVDVNIRVVPWHTDDVMVEIYSYLAEEVDLNNDLMMELLELNAKYAFGSFGVTFDNTVTFSYSLAGANLDENEFVAALQTVATVADQYDERVLEFKK